MPNLNVIDVKPFIGSKDYELSIQFYTRIGFSLNFHTDEIAEFQIGEFRFYLQNYYQKDWCDNSMLHISVEDTSAWYEQVSKVLSEKSFGAARVESPRAQDYGSLVTFVWDPAGVLLHFAQPMDRG